MQNLAPGSSKNLNVWLNAGSYLSSLRTTLVGVLCLGIAL